MDRHLRNLQKLAWVSAEAKDHYIAALERVLYGHSSVGSDYAELCHAINDGIDEVSRLIEKEGLYVGPNAPPSYDHDTYCYNIFLELERGEGYIMGMALGHVLGWAEGLQAIYAPNRPWPSESFEEEDFSKEFVAAVGRLDHTSLRNIYLWKVFTWEEPLINYHV